MNILKVVEVNYLENLLNKYVKTSLCGYACMYIATVQNVKLNSGIVSWIGFLIHNNYKYIQLIIRLLILIETI